MDSTKNLERPAGTVCTYKQAIKKNSTLSEIPMSVVITCGEMLTYRNTMPNAYTSTRSFSVAVVA